MFITAEYRRGLIRTTLAASPRRGRVLAAKAIVIGAVTFVAGLAAAAVAVLARRASLRTANGSYVLPGAALTEVRRDRRHRGAARRRRRPGPRRRDRAAAQRRRRSPPSSWLIVLPYILGDRLRPARRRRGLAAAAHPGRRLRHPAEPPAVPAGHRHLHAAAWLLPAGTVGRFRRAVRLGRARPGPGRCPAAPEGRMSQARPAQRATGQLRGPGRADGARDGHCARPCTRSGPSCAPCRAPAWLLLATIVLTVARRAPRPPRPPVPVRRLQRGPRQAQPHRDRPRPGGRRHPGRAGDQRRVQHRHDPHHPHRDAAPDHRPGRQGGHRHRPGAGRRDRRRAAARCWPGGSSCPATASPPRTATRRCPWPTGRCCAPPPARSSTWP